MDEDDTLSIFVDSSEFPPDNKLRLRSTPATRSQLWPVASGRKKTVRGKSAEDSYLIPPHAPKFAQIPVTATTPSVGGQAGLAPLPFKKSDTLPKNPQQLNQTILTIYSKICTKSLMTYVQKMRN